MSDLNWLYDFLRCTQPYEIQNLRKCVRILNSRLTVDFSSDLKVTVADSSICVEAIFLKLAIEKAFLNKQNANIRFSNLNNYRIYLNEYFVVYLKKPFTNKFKSGMTIVVCDFGIYDDFGAYGRQPLPNRIVILEKYKILRETMMKRVRGNPQLLHDSQDDCNSLENMYKEYYGIFFLDLKKNSEYTKLKLKTTTNNNLKIILKYRTPQTFQSKLKSKKYSSPCNKQSSQHSRVQLHSSQVGSCELLPRVLLSPLTLSPNTKSVIIKKPKIKNIVRKKLLFSHNTIDDETMKKKKKNNNNNNKKNKKNNNKKNRNNKNVDKVITKESGADVNLSEGKQRKNDGKLNRNNNYNNNNDNNKNNNNNKLFEDSNGCSCYNINNNSSNNNNNNNNCNDNNNNNVNDFNIFLNGHIDELTFTNNGSYNINNNIYNNNGIDNYNNFLFNNNHNFGNYDYNIINNYINPGEELNGNSSANAFDIVSFILQDYDDGSSISIFDNNDNNNNDNNVINNSSLSVTLKDNDVVAEGVNIDNNNNNSLNKDDVITTTNDNNEINGLAKQLDNNINKDDDVIEDITINNDIHECNINNSIGNSSSINNSNLNIGNVNNNINSNSNINNNIHNNININPNAHNNYQQQQLMERVNAMTGRFMRGVQHENMLELPLHFFEYTFNYILNRFGN
ncbi:hypothetical protein HELRODRAFT_177267 [Helobdella robusta]|uniref:Uncharacterized protein n=1 Tax=Helobdella robusta TaxID=6412 RepID=T1FBF5_HELRO|nr:hypothetical protein HELRODRAFT_177267 [Helobdella robusta]ESN98038.1 hypothetical protein HELRODRAFT_177267 [Helobdella robusta]